MEDRRGRVDRRTLLKTLGAAGTTGAVISACSGSSANTIGVPGAKFNKSVRLGTAGPGGNREWRPGYALDFLPPEEMPTRGEASSVLAAEPKEKLLEFLPLDEYESQVGNDDEGPLPSR